MGVILKSKLDYYGKKYDVNRNKVVIKGRACRRSRMQELQSSG